jgi:hypothetical protein
MEVHRVTSKGGISVLVLAGSALVAAGVLFLAGCVSFDMSRAIGKQVAPSPAPAPQDETAPAPEQKNARSSEGAGIAYQYQFSAFYGGLWNMGWYGYKDHNYKPGQGTVWTFTGANKKSSEPMIIERALLKVNADSSQWWRFKLDAGKDTIVYEFLVGADTVVKKVRYKDPDSGTVEEFVPSQDRQQPQAGPSNAPRSREEMAKYKVDRQNVKVRGGSFAADHYLYTDEKENGSAENWVSTTVPGYMVKSVYTNKKGKQTVTGELVQIESGVTTILGSF